MGEIAEMMLDGTMCQGCGVFLFDGEDGPGFPMLCTDCFGDPKGEAQGRPTGPQPSPGKHKNRVPHDPR